jgi:hypothetical protein
LTSGTHKLARLRALTDAMAQIEAQQKERFKRGDNPIEADRDAAQLALTCIAEFFLDAGIKTKPIIRLLEEIVALSAGSRLSDMLTPAPTPHRPPDPPSLEGIKGRLAALMEYRQGSGITRKAAAAWVFRQVPLKMKQKLKLGRPSTVDSWMTKWGGDRGARPGDGREGYLHMRAILEQKRPTEPQLKGIMRALAGYVPH